MVLSESTVKIYDMVSMICGIHIYIYIYIDR